MQKKLLSYFLLFISFNSYAFAIDKDTVGASDLRFIENKNQWDKNVLFGADLPGGSMFLEKNCITLNFKDKNQIKKVLSYKNNTGNIKNSKPLSDEDYLINCHSYKMRFNGCNENPEIIKSDTLSDYFNYFIGSDKSKWASNVKSFKSITYKSLYNNVDLRIFNSDSYLKYEFFVHIGGKPENIIIEYDGAKEIYIQDKNLIIKTTVNQVIEIAPYAYQEINNERIKVECRYKLKDNKLTYNFPDGYNKNVDLVIDPVLIFSGVTGSTADNWGFTATYDSYGNIYSGGIAFGVGQYPATTGAYQTHFAGGASNSHDNGCDIAVIKYNSTGTSRLWATYLGGSGDDLPHSMIVDGSDNLLIFGTTGSTNFPVSTDAYDKTFNGGAPLAYDYNSIHFNSGIDIYISKLSAAGSQLLASTYIGGSGNDGLNDPSPLAYNYADGARGEIMVDRNDNVYIVSTTFSNNYPVTANAFQPNNAGGQDGCISVLNYNLSNMIWSSYLGGNGSDAVYGIKVDNNGDLYVCGGTNSTNFPITAGAEQTSNAGGMADGFITKISKYGNIILKSTYWGSYEYDQTYLIDLDKQNYVYVFGQTKAAGNVFIYNAAWNVPGGGQFLTKFHPNLSTVTWSTAFGVATGLPDIAPTALLVDLCKKIYMSGWGSPGLYYYSTPPIHGTSGLPVTSNAQQHTTDGNDFYLLVVDDDASSLVYATYFGGPQSDEHVDGGTSRFDRKGKIYQSVCADCGKNDDFPFTPTAYNRHNGSQNCNNGCFKFDFLLPAIIADFVIPPVICIPDSAHFINTSYTGGPGMTYYWTFGDGGTSTIKDPAHNYPTSGIYNITLIVSDAGTCNFSDTITKQLVVMSDSSYSIPDKFMCTGGSVQIGIPPAPDPSVTYSWTPSNSVSDPHISNPIASPVVTTSYTMLMSNGICTDTIRQKLIVYHLDAFAGHDTTTCNGTVHLTANSSGNADYFQWSSNPYFTDTLNNSVADSTLITNISQPTTFYILVKNEYCQGIDSVKVGFTFIADTTSITIPTCHDFCNASAQIHVVNGLYPPYSYQWNIPGHTSDSLMNVCTGIYSCTLTDANGCISIISIDISNPPGISSNLDIFHLPCDEKCIGKVTSNTTGGTPPYLFHWSNGGNSSYIDNLCEGNYQITITDSKGCFIKDTAVVEIHSVFENVHVYADLYTVYEGQSTGLHATQIPNVQYTWTPSTWLDNPTLSDPTATPLEDIEYCLVMTDQYGCLYTDTLRIKVLDVYCEEPYIFVPSGFSPNGDNSNDKLYIRTNMAQSFYFALFNRWGEKIFETTSSETGWDGTYHNQQCDAGVFVYYLDVTCWNKKHFKKSGNITLIR
jgi:gliding motility-associated-like protein